MSYTVIRMRRLTCDGVTDTSTIYKITPYYLAKIKTHGSNLGFKKPRKFIYMDIKKHRVEGNDKTVFNGKSRK